MITSSSIRQVADSRVGRSKTEHDPDGVAGALEEQEQLRELLPGSKVRDSPATVCPRCTW